ncbi:MAG: LacI family DNA-binding transcriptional regulator [Firmicutes bacterium]|nr:LacI family DNA-binding transcriptional regulator [Bacillota bacterium]
MGYFNSDRPTLKDVAVKAGTSIATASNVISAKKGKFVSEKLRAKVLEAAEELGYLPNVIARSMKGKKRNIIAMLVPELYNSIYMRMVVGAERYATEKGYLMLLCSTLYDPSREEGYMQSLIAQQVDGFLLAVSLSRAVMAEKLERLGIPYVILDTPFFASSFPYDSVAFGGDKAVIMALQHLYDKGHRRIGYVGNVTGEHNERNEAFRKGVRMLGLDERECPSHLGYMNDEDCERMMKECIKESRCTAIVIGHHMVAESIVRQMRRLNIQVPRDISVVVVGNPIWTEMAGPGFTAVELPHPEMGRLAAKMLIDRIEGHAGEKKQVWLQSELIERASVADLNARQGRSQE